MALRSPGDRLPSLEVLPEQQARSGQWRVEDQHLVRVLDDLDVVVESVAKDQFRLLTDRGEDQVLHRPADTCLRPDHAKDGVAGLQPSRFDREAIATQRFAKSTWDAIAIRRRCRA